MTVPATILFITLMATATALLVVSIVELWIELAKPLDHESYLLKDDPEKESW